MSNGFSWRRVQVALARQPWKLFTNHSKVHGNFSFVNFKVFSSEHNFCFRVHLIVGPSRTRWIQEDLLIHISSLPNTNTMLVPRGTTWMILYQWQWAESIYHVIMMTKKSLSLMERFTKNPLRWLAGVRPTTFITPLGFGPIRSVAIWSTDCQNAKTNAGGIPSGGNNHYGIGHIQYVFKARFRSIFWWNCLHSSIGLVIPLPIGADIKITCSTRQTHFLTGITSPPNAKWLETSRYGPTATTYLPVCFAVRLSLLNLIWMLANN